MVSRIYPNIFYLRFCIQPSHEYTNFLLEPTKTESTPALFRHILLDKDPITLISQVIEICNPLTD